jgi:hypothetical protein
MTEMVPSFREHLGMADTFASCSFCERMTSGLPAVQPDTVMAQASASDAVAARL